MSKTNSPEDLPGIQIYYQKIGFEPGERYQLGKQTADGSDFSVLFGPILDRVEKFTWIFEEDAFDFSPLVAAGDDEAVAKRLEPFEFETGYQVTDSGLIQELTVLLNDDWNRIWGLERQGQGEIRVRDRWIDPTCWHRVNFIFDNYDAAYWAFDARDPTLLNAVVSHVRAIEHSISHLRIGHASFKQRVQTHKQEWETYRRTWFGDV